MIQALKNIWDKIFHKKEDCFFYRNSFCDKIPAIWPFVKPRTCKGICEKFESRRKDV